MNKKLHILSLTSWYPNESDIQQGVFVKQQIEALKKDYRVTLLLVRPGMKSNFSVQENDNLNTITYTYKNNFKALKPLNWILAWGKMRNHIKNENFDIIHLHVIFPMGIIALWLQKQFAIPLVVTEHWSGYGNKKSYSGILRKKIANKISKKAKAFIVQSNFLKQNMLREGLYGNYFIVPNLVRFEEYELTRKTKSNSINILNVADHVDSTKNISGMLQAFKQAIHKNSKLKLTQIGGGQDSEALKSLSKELKLSDNVIWKGRLENAEVLKEIKECDFGIINSNIETFSIAAFEFLAAGKPIIITKCGGPEEYLPSGFGLYTTVRNSQELAQNIIEMANSCKSFPMVEVQQQVRNEFSEASFLKRINKVYSQVIA